jgi:hypothetical protein
MSTPSPVNPSKKGLAAAFDIFPHVNDAIVLVGLIALAYAGIAVSSVSPAISYLYWMAVTPVFALVSLYTEWARERGSGASWATLLRTQLLHWGGLAVVVSLIYLYLSTGRLTNESAGFLIHLFLAFATFIVGAYVDWRFFVVSFFLALSFVVAIYVAAYMWVLLFAAFATVIVTIWVERR